MTELVYLKDFNVETCNAIVLGADTYDDNKIDIILNKTCFYPRGGGQDWDMGKIIAGDKVFLVEEVRLDVHGIVHHVGTSADLFIVDDQVTCVVDHERRLINTRLHSGGHVIDMAIDSLGLDWITTKGQHYPHLSAVEYSGTWEPEKVDELRSAIEARANQFIQKGIENKIVFMPVEEMHTVCRHVPDNIPTNKPGRVVVYGEDFGVPCGGTHVKNLHQIGSIKVSKLKAKKGIIRVNYEIEGIN
jgi:Ser-tRNA(Ala) deacylase AlaX